MIYYRHSFDTRSRFNIAFYQLETFKVIIYLSPDDKRRNNVVFIDVVCDHQYS